jgi:hypothetical protein
VLEGWKINLFTLAHICGCFFQHTYNLLPGNTPVFRGFSRFLISLQAAASEHAIFGDGAIFASARYLSSSRSIPN